MSSFATVIFSPFSPAISSSTGATILHGPHQVAQKSTRTGFSLVSTSSTNEASVTLTVLLMFLLWDESAEGSSSSVGGRAVAAADQFGRLVGALDTGVFRQPAFGVDRGRAPRTR